MGNLYSHLPSVNSYEEMGEEKSGEVTPADQTPAPLEDGSKLTKDFLALIDPRSPTVGVSRTPVEVVAERERTRLERARRLRTLNPPAVSVATTEEKGAGDKTDGAVESDVTTPTGFLDPRSPTFEYNRTPLGLGGDNVDKPEDSREGVADSYGDDVTALSGKKVIECELNVPSNSSQLSRDLRKRLFAAQFNDAPVDTQEEDKEN